MRALTALNERPLRKRVSSVLLGAVLCGPGCCGGETFLAVLVIAGKIILTTAVAVTTVTLLDRLLGNEADADFAVDPLNPNRGRFRSLVFRPKGGGREVVLVDVPAVKGDDYKWHIDPDYVPKVEDALRKARSGGE